jgi:hypothetical protein
VRAAANKAILRMRIIFLRLMAVEHSDPRERRSWGEEGLAVARSLKMARVPKRREGLLREPRTKRRAPRVLHHAEPETERRIGAGGLGEPPLV